jgi:hypothetical protein
VTTDKIDDAAVTFDKMSVFISTEQTGTGMEEDIPHTLGVVPAAVVVIPSSNAMIMDGLFAFTQGMHTNTVIKIDATADAAFYVLAWG